MRTAIEEVNDFALYLKGKEVDEMLNGIDELDEVTFNSLSPDDIKAYEFFVKSLEDKNKMEFYNELTSVISTRAVSKRKA